MALMILRCRCVGQLLVSAALSAASSAALAQFAPGPEYFNQPALATVNSLPAYNAGLSGAGVGIGVVDSGINPSHLEFAHAITAGYDSVKDRSGTSDFSSFLHDYPEYSNHGSFTASVAAGRLDGGARADNIQGVAYNAGIVMGSISFDLVYYDRLPIAFDYVSGQAVRVINNSWNTAEHPDDPALDYQTLLHELPQLIPAIKTALDRDIVVVFAAGNEEQASPATPAVLPLFDAEMAAKGGFIVVAASTIDGKELAYYSNRCGITKAYCIVAPGGSGDDGQPPAQQGILGVDGGTNDSYFYQAGTSAAAPIVSGAVALVAEQFPWMTNRNLATTILTTASRAQTPDDEWGRGLLNIGKAIDGPGIFEEDFAANVSGGYISTFSNNISGTAGLKKLGSGTLILSGNNTYSGDTYLNGGDLVVYRQANLGSSVSALQFDGGTLKVGADFALGRSLLIGPGGGTLDTGNHTLTYSGSDIRGGGTLTVFGTLAFVGKPVTLDSDLALNGIWNADLFILATRTLQGLGLVNGDLTVAGTVSPGNSPGTLAVTGSMLSLPGSNFVVDIDGVGSGIGAGNHDRVLLTGASSTYTAGGSLITLLRGISGAASNTYQPAVGQGFEFVSAPGGVLGEFNTFAQPSAGLLPGTRMDLVYGPNALTLYATPASYADIGAADIPNNANRQQLGSILEGIRPASGIRESNASTKRLFDSLAPQSQSSLPIGMDQLGGVGYAQLIGMHFENTKFLTEQTMAAVSSQRRGESPQLTGPAANARTDNSAEQLWTLALGRSSRWAGDSTAYRVSDTLGGLMGGVQKRLDAQTRAGFSLSYARSHPEVEDNIGNGSTQNLQLSTYASRSFDDGFFVQGAVGGGAGRIEAKRSVSILGSQYDANIDTTNLNASALAGWARGDRDTVRYETSLGLNYLVLRSAGFQDNARDALGQISVKAQTQESLSATLATSISVPFQAKGIDWRGSVFAGFTHAFTDTRSTLDANLLEQPYRIESGTIGRNRLNLDLALSGDLSQRARIGFDLSWQSAHHWHAKTASVWAHLAF